MDKTKVFQSGEKSVYIEENTGQITIHTPNGVQIINPGNSEDLEILKNEFRDNFTEILLLIRELINRNPKIPHHLTSPPFLPEYFIGRDDDLERIHNKLFTGKNLLLLVNGEGGVGKTAVASKYFHKYQHEYRHVAWVLSENSIADALLRLAPKLGLTFGEQMNTDERLDALAAVLAELEKPCLLIVDNANELSDFELHYQRMCSLRNFHLLLTTRITNFQLAETFAIEGLPEIDALKLFEEYYRTLQPDEQELFYKIRDAVGENTLVIELMAKNLSALNNDLATRLTLAQLLADLQQKGVLHITQTEKVHTGFHAKAGKLRHEKPDDIIAAMYELSGLTAPETALLSVFAVLPPESIPFATLKTLLPGHADLDKPLLALRQKGWIENNKTTAAFKCSPVVQEVTRLKNTSLRADCENLVNTLIEKLFYEGGTGHFLNATYVEAQLYARFAEAVLSVFDKPDLDFSILSERIGNFHQTTGNIEKALLYFDKGIENDNALYEEEPKNADYKNNLAISYEKLGATHSAFGNLEKALKYFENYNKLEKELHEAFPENVEFKNSLAISYQNLGNTLAMLGNLDKALDFYEKYNRLEKELYEVFPQNVSLINGLAISYEKLGDTHADLGNLEKALKYYEDMAAIFEELYEAFPQNVDFKNNLAISYSKLGDTHADLGNLEKALKYFEKDLELTKELYEAIQQNVSFKDGLAISYSKLGETHAALGTLEKALDYYEKSNQLEKELYEAFPQNVSFKNGLAISYSKLGETHAALGNLDKELDSYEKSNLLEKELYEDWPQNVVFKNGFAISYSKLGLVYVRKGDLESSIEPFKNYKFISMELFKDFPSNINFISDFAESLVVWSAINQLTFKFEDTDELRTGMEIFDDLYNQTKIQKFIKKANLIEKMMQKNTDLKSLIIEISLF